MTIRIWHQSLTDLTQLPGYARMLEEHARRICGADTVVDLHGLRPGTYPGGMAPVEMTRYRWAHHLAFAFAEILVQLRRRSGLATGRRGAYARPNEQLVRQLRKITTEVLHDAQTRTNT
jgi:hypothetical protein